MKSGQKIKKKRWWFSLMLLIILLLTTLSLAGILSYFRTGAESLEIYDQGIKQLAKHNPQIKWMPDDENLGGEINKYLRKEITQSYADAWGILNLSMSAGRDLGLIENFTEEQVAMINQDLNAYNSVSREDLSHKLKLHFISIDKSVISFSDLQMISKIQIRDTASVTMIQDTAAYQLVMTLNDSKWRVNKIIRTK